MSPAGQGEDAESEVGRPADAGAAPAAGADAAADAAATQTSRPAVDEEQASVDVMRLLSEHVPLTLLADLAQPIGPDSPDILEHEGLPDVAWWETGAEEHQQH